MKILIFDSSTIINLTMNGLLEILKNLKLIFPGKFILTPQVKKEVIDRPITMKEYELSALKVKQLLDEKVLEFPESIGIENFELDKKTQEILKLTNNLFSAEGENIKLIHDGEASCLALSILAKKNNINNMIAIDERTTRMIVEKPENLRKILKRKLHQSVYMKAKPPKLDIKIIRSSELVYVAYKKNLVQLKNGNVLDALLYATKFKGSAISDEEIEQIKKIQ